MTQTASSALSSIITFEVQQAVLKNLRTMLVYANRDNAEQGTLRQGTDTATFVTIPDLSDATTALTEGNAPTAVALSVSKVDITCAQYGCLGLAA